MAKRQEWVVRVVLFPYDQQGGEDTILEWLRYAAVVHVHRGATGAKEIMVFDILPPCKNTHDTRAWAQQNAARISSYGINAEACPAAQPYEEPEEGPDNVKLPLSSRPECDRDM